MRRKDDLYSPLWEAVPRGVHNAATAGFLAKSAGLEPRSAGTKLDAMWKGGYGQLGLAFYLTSGEGSQRMWWRA